MAKSFDATNAPFDRLTPQQIGAVEAALDIGYFRPGETLIARDGAPNSLFVVIKGCVEERDGDEVVGLRGPGDCFDSRALVQGAGSNAFVAREETLCNLAPRDLILRLINHNDRFAAFFYREISRKLEAAARDQEAARFSPLLGARVRDVPLHPAVFIEAERDDRERRRENARDQDQRAVRARRRARRSADRHAPGQSGDPRAQADRRRASPTWRNTKSSRSTSTISSRARCSG